jgi:Alginate lyase
MCHRPKSYAYHDFELEAYVRLALQAEQVNVDLWTFQAESYNSILVSAHLFRTTIKHTIAACYQMSIINQHWCTC